VRALVAAVVVAAAVTACGSSGSKSATPTTVAGTPGVPGKSQLVLDIANTSALPRNFRIAAPDQVPKDQSVNQTGLADLRESGSAVFGSDALPTIKNKINASPIVDVDLRQESHLYVNGVPVTWFGDNDDANITLTHDQVLADEAKKKQELIASPAIQFEDIGKKSVPPTGPVRDPKTVQTEEELVKSAGLGYFRLTVPDHIRPQDTEVDRFVAFVRDLPPGTWLHFHCRAGIGRTTSFMAMYDMMRNAKSVSLDDILQRQVALGGKDLTASDANGDENKAERAQFIQRFYDYAKNNNDGFKTPFSASAQSTTSTTSS
jgi:hypothetical protein